MTFKRIAETVSEWVGSPVAFVGAVALVVTWAVAGPFLGFSNTWQLFINTTTTVATFLIVFLLQNSQNRATRAMNIKLDELIEKLPGPDNDKAHIEDRME